MGVIPALLPAHLTHLDISGVGHQDKVPSPGDSWSVLDPNLELTLKITAAG